MIFSVKFTSALALASLLGAHVANASLFNLQETAQPTFNLQRTSDNHDDQNQDQNQNQGCKEEDGKNQTDKCLKTMRVDCRYHNAESLHGVGFCYASAVYSPSDEGYQDVRMGVGCDSQTIYNDFGRVQTETVGERISPPTAAFPGIEIFPQGALLTTGTYESILDIRAGRMAGTCYVHEVSN